MVEHHQAVSVVLAVVLLRMAVSSLVWDRMMHSRIKENHSLPSKTMQMVKCRDDEFFRSMKINNFEDSNSTKSFISPSILCITPFEKKWTYFSSNAFKKGINRPVRLFEVSK